jgi:FAD/FMN-containing dehydrogenase
MRRFGLACDNLLSVDVVTADGKPSRPVPVRNADLFWGVRGSGWNFGIVTFFEYRLHPLSHVLGGLLVYPMDKARDVLRLCREVNYTAPDELAAFAVLATLPDGTRAAVVPVCYSGPLEKGEEILRPFRAFGPPLIDQVRPYRIPRYRA